MKMLEGKLSKKLMAASFYNYEFAPDQLKA